MEQPEIDTTVHKTIANASQQLRSLSQYLCDNPELGRCEVKAHAALTSLLQDSGFSVKPHFPCETGFVASYIEKDESQPHVVLLCEYDALPDIGHACGHNLIAVAAVGAALAVRTAMKEFGLSGRVSVFGTPAEEGDGGKVDFIDAGLFKDVDAALMVHPSGGTVNVVNPRSTAKVAYNVIYHGKASHAAAAPWEAINALDAAVQAYQNISNLRQHIPPQWNVSGIITEGGVAANIIPERSALTFFLRAQSSKALDELVAKWKNCINGAAMATGCKVEIIKKKGNAYEDLDGNNVIASIYQKHASAKGLETIPGGNYSWSTDTGNVSKVVPTLQPCFHIGAESWNHERGFAKDVAQDKAFDFTIQQANIIALTVVDILKDKETRLKIREEFETSE